MSNWGQAQQLPQEYLQQIRAIYDDRFPIEVRHCLASWLESRIWAVDPNNHQDYFVEELVQELTSSSDSLQSPDHFVMQMKLKDAAKNFQMRYSHAPHELFLYMRSCLSAEMDVMSRVNKMTPQYDGLPQERKYSELIQGLQTVRQKVTMASEHIRNLQSNIESFSLRYHECMKNRGHLTYLEQQSPMTPDRRELEVCLRLQIDEMEKKLNGLGNQIKQSQLELVDLIKENIAILRQLQSQVLDEELIKWKREQQLSGNGVPMNSNHLNTIQDWCELLAELIWTSRQQLSSIVRINSKTIPQLHQPHVADMLDDMGKQVTSLLSTLVTSTFVIEKQPPQVMKTNTRFTATVRLLVGGQLNVHMTPPRVNVMIISEQQAQQLLKSEGHGRGGKPQECGEILNNTGAMEYQPTNRQLSVSFRNMQLRKIKRAEKKGTESVMDEKLALLFQSEFNVGGGELVFQVWTLSLPVVVIVHGNQEPHGWATVTWDNAFSALGRVPFAVPEKVTWGQLAETLRIKFCSATGADLSADNLRFLAEKIFKTSVPINKMELDVMPVSWAQFCKDPLPERNFTFWEWFYMVVKVTRDHLKALWCDRLIMGFIQKKQAEDTLSKCPPGTFLLRFSDSELGGITIAWVGDGNEVFSLQPFTSRDLILRPLADRIQDLQQLQYLYPNVSKDEVFAKYYAKPENEMIKNGYVRPVLVTTLPHYMSSPAYAPSPDSHRNTPSAHSSYFGSSTPAPTEYSFMDSELIEQIRSFDPDAIDFSFEGN